MNAIEELDGLLAKLSGETTEDAVGDPHESSPDDAIDQTLATPQRATAARRLREDPVMLRFREEMSRGVVHADTARGVLGLLSQVLDTVLSTRG